MLNIGQVEYGNNALNRLPDLAGDKTLILTQPDPWKAVKSRVPSLRAGEVRMVDSVYKEDLERLVHLSEPFTRVIGMGGGMAIDAAKYVSSMTGKPLTQVPTIISTNAFATEGAGVRMENGRVEYLGHAYAENLIVDFELLRKAPADLTHAGAGDILSCHTASRDWEMAVEDGVQDHPMNESAVRKSRQLVQRLGDHAADIRTLTDVGLKVLLDVNLEIVEICQPMGHYRSEEGSEHFLFYAIEQLTRRPYVHGHIIGLGIYVMSLLQNNRPDEIVRLMDDLGLEWQPKTMQLSREVLTQALDMLPKFVRKQGYWHSVIHRGIPDGFAEQAFKSLTF